MRVTIHGCRLRAILDTGSSINIISRGLLNTLNIEEVLQESRVRIGTLGTDIISPIGSLNLPIEIGNRVHFTLVHVVDHFPYADLLLGTQFMRGAEVVIDMGRRKIHIGNDFHVKIAEENSGATPQIVTASTLLSRSKKTLSSNECRQPHGARTHCLPGTVPSPREGKKYATRVFKRIRGWRKDPKSWRSYPNEETKKRLQLKTINYIKWFFEDEHESCCPDHPPPDIHQREDCDSRVLFLTDEWEAEGLEQEPPPATEPDINASMEQADQDRLRDLIKRFDHIFSKGEHDIGCANVKPAKLVTGDQAPINIRPYKNPAALIKELQRQIDALLAADIIEPSTSPWSFPSILVPKKSKKYRLTINYKKLNDILKKNAMAPPDIESIMERLGGMQYLTILDARSGFFHIPLDEDSREKTAFRGPFGSYQFKRLPQGLATAPAIFQQVMNDMLGELQLDCAVAYMDDVIVFSRTLEEHEAHLEAVFKKLEAMNIKISMEKSEFAKHEVSFLGRLVSREGMRPDPKKVEAIRTFPRPMTKKKIQQFIGMCSYQRKLIPGFSQIITPIRKLMNDPTIGWQEEQEYAYVTLIEKLTSAPILQFPDYGKRFYLFCDASNDALGALLKQKDENGHFRLVACASRKLTPAEKNYATTYKECLAIYYGVSQFQQMITGVEFTVVTDHHSLCYLQKMIKPHGVLPRWIMALMNFDFTIEWTSGRSHKEADALSRVTEGDEEEIAPDTVIDSRDMCAMPSGTPLSSLSELHKLQAAGWNMSDLPLIHELTLTEHDSVCEPDEETNPSARQEKDSGEDDFDSMPLLLASSLPMADVITDLASKQREDPTLAGWINYHETRETPATVKNTRHFKKKMQCYAMKGNILCRLVLTSSRETKRLPVIPHSLRAKVIRAFHDLPQSGHQGHHKMIPRMRDHVFWERLSSDVIEYVTGCIKCAQQNVSHTVPAGELLPLPANCAPGEILSMDTQTKLTRSRSGNTCIFVACCRSTRYVWAMPAPGCESLYAVRLLRRIIFSHGPPREVLTDGGSEYISAEFNQLLREFQITHRHSDPYFPQTNGQVERVNGIIAPILSKFVDSNHRDWDCHLEPAIYAINTSIHSLTGFAPYHLMYGQLPPPPIRILSEEQEADPDPFSALRIIDQIREEANQNLVTAQREYKRKSDENKAPSTLKVGEQVMLKNHQFEEGLCRKLQAKYRGPFTITRIAGRNSVEIEREGTRHRTNVVNVANLRRFVPRDESLSVIPEETDESAEPVREKEEGPPPVPQVETVTQAVKYFAERSGSVPEDPVQVRRSSRLRRAPDRLVLLTYSQLISSLASLITPRLNQTK